MGLRIVVELQKSRYGVDGDVDIAVWKNPHTEHETLIGVEVKVIFLEETGEFKSEKLKKHNKQIKALEKEGWDYIYFFDFIVNKPSLDWFHPQAFEGHDKYRKSVDSKIAGHVVFQINSVAHKPERDAGSISPVIHKRAIRNPNNKGRDKMIEALNYLDFSCSSTVIDSK